MIINAEAINNILAKNRAEDPVRIKEILAKARAIKGLTLDETAALIASKNPELCAEIFTTAKQVKLEIYGNRLVLFAPLYISNLCSNECLYCAFRASNKPLTRRSLTQNEINQETINLVEQGQKRLLLVAGETHARNGLQYILDAINTIYNAKSKHGEIRRINVNIAPLTVANFKRLKAAQIGTYQLFQETYHAPTYHKVHVVGKKTDYNWRLTAIDRAMQAGIDDVGIGVLFGLANWRFEILALLQHTHYLENKFGVGPHTISVPRLEPASGSELSRNPPHPVSDADFRKIIAILRLAVPFTGIILSTRETAQMRREALSLGVSQISAGSRTNPGGYSKNEDNASQFSLGDHRPIDAVIRDIASLGYIPSFCTACYRLGRTGEHFMDLAKTGKIKNMCTPNALATFAEYLTDYASAETQQIGAKLISQEIANMPKKQAEIVAKMLARIKAGKHDVYI
jgi:2-iminoacetate synthase